MKLTQPIWTRFLPTPVVLGWATLGPIGRRLPAPGTWGSLAGLLYFTVLFLNPVDRGEPLWLGIAGNLALSAVAGYVAVGVCGEAEFRMARKDPGEVILDEFVAMPLCFLGWPALLHPLQPWEVFLLGFGLFRLFDILKPFGIRRLQYLPGGWGIVIDDTAAALAACATLHLGQWAWHLRG